MSPEHGTSPTAMSEAARGVGERAVCLPPALRSEVQTPRMLRQPRYVMVLMLLLIGAVLAWTPWQQTVFGTGTVIAYSPQDREQRIDAPVEGRVRQWFVREGETVQEGQLLAEVSDNDPELMTRLRIEHAAIVERREAARLRASAVEARITALESGRKAALAAAQHRVKMALERVRAADRAVEAAQTAEKVAQANLDRQRSLGGKGIASGRTLDLAELDYARAVTDLDRAEAASALARSEQLAIEADRVRLDADTNASLEDARSAHGAARIEVQNAEAELARIDVRLARQNAQTVKATRGGVIHRIVAREGGDVLRVGDLMAIVIPAGERAAEILVQGRDVTLLAENDSVRLEFEGWPALLVSGWASSAVGTFGGRVAFVDALDDGKGNYRVVVVPDGHGAWPSDAMLRQGMRARGWFLLRRVRLGYELWRLWNGFPPSLKATAGPLEKKGK